MLRNKWITKLENLMVQEGEDTLPLNWDSDDWKHWNDGDLTHDQLEMVKACNFWAVEPRPGEKSPDTITFR